jgi:hypothetical protein
MSVRGRRVVGTRMCVGFKSDEVMCRRVACLSQAKPKGKPGRPPKAKPQRWSNGASDDDYSDSD